jgi:hypothetical protein
MTRTIAIATCVGLRYFERSGVRRLTYHMTKTAAGWRVRDIEHDSHASLVTMLRGKP